MIKPVTLRNKDLICFSSMSDGIINEEKKRKLLESKLRLEKIFNVIEDKYINNSKYGESAKALLRAKELEEHINNPNIKCIMSVTGGNYLIEILGYLDFNSIKNNIKWFQGHSDTTVLLYILTTKYDIQTIYSYNSNALAKVSDMEFGNNIDILKGENIIQLDYQYTIKDKVRVNSAWKFNRNIIETGRMIGGCLECIIDIVGTEFDNTLNFIEKYKHDGIIWYFDIDYMVNEQLLRSIWHLNELGWFKYTKCIIFGRNEEENYTGIDIDSAIKRGLKGTKIKYITNFDLGHTYPRISIVNGSIVKIVADDKEKYIEILE